MLVYPKQYHIIYNKHGTKQNPTLPAESEGEEEFLDSEALPELYNLVQTHLRSMVYQPPSMAKNFPDIYSTKSIIWSYRTNVSMEVEMRRRFIGQVRAGQCDNLLSTLVILPID